MAGSDIERSPTTADDERVGAPTRFRLIVRTGVEPMTDVVIGAPPFVSEVVRIERRAAGSIVDAAALVQGVRGPKSNFLDGAVSAKAEVVGSRSAVGLIL